MHAIETEVALVGKHFPRIEKERKVDERHDLPPILRRDIEIARVPKAPFTKPPYRRGAAKRLHQVERNFFSAIGYGVRRVEAQRQDAALGPERYIAFDIRNDPREVVYAQTGILVAFGGDAGHDAHAGIRPFVPQVELDPSASNEEIGPRVHEAGHFVGFEDVFDRALHVARIGPRREPTALSAEREKPARVEPEITHGALVVEQIGRAIIDARVVPEAVEAQRCQVTILASEF